MRSRDVGVGHTQDSLTMAPLVHKGYNKVRTADAVSHQYIYSTNVL